MILHGDVSLTVSSYLNNNWKSLTWCSRWYFVRQDQLYRIRILHGIEYYVKYWRLPEQLIGNYVNNNAYYVFYAFIARWFIHVLCNRITLFGLKKLDNGTGISNYKLRLSDSFVSLHSFLKPCANSRRWKSGSRVTPVANGSPINIINHKPPRYESRQLLIYL